MKRKIIYPLFVLLFCAGTEFPAQLVIDMSTGVNDSPPFNLLPASAQFAPSYDDTWMIAGPNSLTTYQPVRIGNGVLTGQANNQSYPPGNPNARWLSPYIDNNGNHVGGQSGEVFNYRMNFNPGTFNCPIASANIFFQYLGVDDDLTQILVNGIQVFPSQSLPTLSAFNNNGVNIPVGGIINSNVQNTIVIQVTNTNGLWTGLKIKGNLTIQLQSVLEYHLADKNGTPKTDFCLNEDIFIRGSGAKSSDCAIRLFQGAVNANPVSWIQVTTSSSPYVEKNFFGTPDGFNLSSFFANQSPPFTLWLAYQNVYGAPIGAIYRLELMIYGSCGTRTINLDYMVHCCEQQTDAPFKAKFTNNGTKLEGTGEGNQIQDWQIYNTSTPLGGSSAPIMTFNNKHDFSMSVTPGSCYYIKHNISNGCGTKCTSRSLCNLDCGDIVCDIGQPVPQHYDPSTYELTWSVVPGAAYYIVQLTIDDASCCPPLAGDGSGAGVGQAFPTNFKTFNASNNFYFLNPADLNGNIITDGNHCFSWKVRSVCPDGYKSPFSSPRCSSLLRPANTGEVTGMQPTEDISGATDVDIFPNPATNQVNIDVTTAGEDVVGIEIFDGTGKLIKNFTNIKRTNNAPTIKLDSKSWISGIYLVKVTITGKQVINKKLVIE